MSDNRFYYRLIRAFGGSPQSPIKTLSCPFKAGPLSARAELSYLQIPAVESRRKILRIPRGRLARLLILAQRRAIRIRRDLYANCSRLSLSLAQNSSGTSFGKAARARLIRPTAPLFTRAREVSGKISSEGNVASATAGKRALPAVAARVYFSRQTSIISSCAKL